MKKILSVILMLSFLLFAFAVPASAVPGEINGNSLNVVNPQGGWYVITTLLKPGVFKFNCGWNNDKTFEYTPVKYWVSVYHVTARNDDGVVTAGHDEVGYPVIGTVAAEDSKMLKLSFETLDLETGGEYKVNFFIYGINELGVCVRFSGADGDTTGIVFIAP